MSSFCCTNKDRKIAVLEHPTMNGIDFIEVIDNPSDVDEIRQTVLSIHFIKDITDGALVSTNIKITGGERIQNIQVVSVTHGSLLPATDPNAHANVLMVQLNKAGDFSIYQLKIITNEANQNPPDGFDSLLSTINFSFKAACPNEFDCKQETNCNSPIKKEKPVINYLAKDYASIRQLMLDRMALTIPEWQERNPADMGVMLVELLAYTADYLSYSQDAIATEAYLGTARKRISVKRHARLVDYHMHEGCSACTWVHLEVAEGINGVLLKGNHHGNSLKFLTALPGKATIIKKDSSEADELLKTNGFEVFEPLHDLELFSDLNKLNFYTWQQKKCSLNKNATSATLEGHIHNLSGKILIIQEEVTSPTNNKNDANIFKRHAIKVLTAEHTSDALTLQPSSEEIPVTKITWSDEDALPFSICVSTLNNEGEKINTASLIGNNVLAGHGNTIEEEIIFTQKTKSPSLKHKNLSYGIPTQTTQEKSAYKQYNNLPELSMPYIYLKEINDTEAIWLPVKDLISGNFNSRHFVIETDNYGKAYLRFGNDITGRKPVEGTAFKAIYRTGIGNNGNIATEVLKHVISNDPAINSDTIIKISNLLPAKGGTAPESIEEVKLKAPVAFRKQQRAVTTEDYELLTESFNKNIQRSRATPRWTGSWRTMFLEVDTLIGLNNFEEATTALRNYLEKFRLAGQDLKIDKPRYVSLEIEAEICIKKGYNSSDVKQAILQSISSGVLSNGKKGLFHPDNFTFGQPVYLSSIYTEIQSQEGVASVTIKKFGRLGKNDTTALATGILQIGKSEIARLENNPNALEKGIFIVNVS